MKRHEQQHLVQRLIDARTALHATDVAVRSEALDEIRHIRGTAINDGSAVIWRTIDDEARRRLQEQESGDG